jgi:WhiB family redox-sensing transcriptional regulator
MDQSWWRQAACRGLDPAMFFPEPGESLTTRAAQAVCDDCSVRAACLSYALDIGEARGIWGGATPNDRRALRRQRQGAA